MKSERNKSEGQKGDDSVSKLAHDIRTPLVIIDNFLAYISSQIRDEDMRTFYEAACLSLKKVERLVDSLRAGSSLQPSTTGDSILRNYCDMVELIRGVLAELQPMAKTKGVRLSFIGPDHLVCLVDPLAIERVVANLVKNGLEAADKVEGFVIVKLYQCGSSVSVDVRDNGRGIAPEYIDKIFDVGFTYGKEGGEGIGLAYCKEAVESHGGSITVHSRPGVGTLFTIVIPSSVVAVCDVNIGNQQMPGPSASLRICTVDGATQGLRRWISHWRSIYKTDEIRHVNDGRFTIGYVEDSIGFD